MYLQIIIGKFFGQRREPLRQCYCTYRRFVVEIITGILFESDIINPAVFVHLKIDDRLQNDVFSFKRILPVFVDFIKKNIQIIRISEPSAAARVYGRFYIRQTFF